jgi:hypothetical protein
LSQVGAGLVAAACNLLFAAPGLPGLEQMPRSSVSVGEGGARGEAVGYINIRVKETVFFLALAGSATPTKRITTKMAWETCTYTLRCL